MSPFPPRNSTPLNKHWRWRGTGWDARQRSGPWSLRDSGGAPPRGSLWAKRLSHATRMACGDSGFPLHAMGPQHRRCQGEDEARRALGWELRSQWKWPEGWRGRKSLARAHGRDQAARAAFTLTCGESSGRWAQAPERQPGRPPGRRRAGAGTPKGPSASRCASDNDLRST